MSPMTLATLFARGKPDKTGLLLQKIGGYAFTVFVVAFTIGYLAERVGLGTQWVIWITAFFAGAGIILSIFMMVAVGIHYAGRDHGMKNFISSTGLVLKKTFLYVFLPSIALMMLVYVWAVYTQQPLVTKDVNDTQNSGISIE